MITVLWYTGPSGVGLAHHAVLPMAIWEQSGVQDRAVGGVLGGRGGLGHWRDIEEGSRVVTSTFNSNSSPLVSREMVQLISQDKWLTDGCCSLWSVVCLSEVGKKSIIIYPHEVSANLLLSPAGTWSITRFPLRTCLPRSVSSTCTLAWDWVRWVWLAMIGFKQFDEEGK